MPILAPIRVTQRSMMEELDALVRISQSRQNWDAQYLPHQWDASQLPVCS